MTKRPWKCTECTFRAVSLKGMSIHRGKTHGKRARDFAEPVRVARLPENFVKSLNPQQLELLGGSHRSHWANPHHSQRYSDPGFADDSSTTPNRLSSFSKNEYASLRLNSSECLPPQRSDGPYSSGSFSTSQERECYSSTQEVSLNDAPLDRPQSAATPTGIAPIETPEPDSGSMARAGMAQYLNRFDNGAGAGQPPDHPTSPFSTSKGSLDPIEHGTKRSPDSTPKRSTDDRNQPNETSAGSDTTEFRMTEPTEKPDPPTANPREPARSSRTENRAPVDFLDDIGDMNNSFRWGSARGLHRARSTSRNALKNLWPACSFDFPWVQHGEGGSSRRDKELRARRHFLTLLGDCAVLDYNASSAWDLVLRCSLCDMPLSGLKNMETHIKNHLQ